MKHYRVKLFILGNPSADKAILAAAASNGSDQPFTLQNIKAIGEAENAPDVNFELVGYPNPTLLCIDVKINGEWESAATIELVEISELICQEEEVNL